MRRLIAAASVAMALAFGGSASAKLIFKETGASAHPSAYVNLPGAGIYQFIVTLDAPADIYMNAGYESHWDIFRVPSPRPHEENLTGNENFVERSASGRGTTLVFDFVVPHLQRTYFKATNNNGYNVTPGTPLFREERYLDPYVFFGTDDQWNSLSHQYTFKIYDLSPVPEPTTWAMLIVGFGLAGGGLRGARARQQERLEPQRAS